LLSKEAHRSSAAGDATLVEDLEKEVDRHATELWELSLAELAEIQNSLRDA